MRSFINCKLKYFSGDQIKGNEMVWACGAHGRDEKCVQYIC
jgi:hypothetical protein